MIELMSYMKREVLILWFAIWIATGIPVILLYDVKMDLMDWSFSRVVEASNHICNSRLSSVYQSTYNLTDRKSVV